MSDTTELLNSLRDIQEPIAPEGTSLLLLAGNGILLLSIIVFVLWRSHRRKHAWRRQALLQLERSRHAQPDTALLQKATLLRQILLYHKQECRQLTGDDYLQVLDSVFDTRWFTQSTGQYFGDRLYQQNKLNRTDIEAIHLQLDKLIRAMPNTLDKPAT